MKETVNDGACNAVAELLRIAGIAGEPVLYPLAGGRNNRAYHVEMGAMRFVMKLYGEADAGGEERLDRELAFTQFAWKSGSRRIAEPIAMAREHRAALFRFVESRPCTASDATRDTVEQAAAFIREINQFRNHVDAAALPHAAEACFSIDEHLACVDRRVDALRRELSLSAISSIQRDAAVFVNGELGPAWRMVRARMVVSVSRLGLDCHKLIDPSRRVLSPSDFGLHNALVDARGCLTFVDFEYAGWDDPAKLVCDFFCQPAVPIPLTMLDSFIDSALEEHTDKDRRRMVLLLPVYRVKWACILLNEFRTIGRQRRNFAKHEDVNDAHLEAQLRKAEHMLASANDVMAHGVNKRHCA